MNLCSKPDHKIKTEHLIEKLLELLNKIDNCDYEIVPIILDGAPVKIKLARNLRPFENPNDDMNKMKLAGLKLKLHFAHNGKKRFILFCSVHVVKCMRNCLCKKILFSNILVELCLPEIR